MAETRLSYGISMLAKTQDASDASACFRDFSDILVCACTFAATVQTGLSVIVLWMCCERVLTQQSSHDSSIDLSTESTNLLPANRNGCKQKVGPQSPAVEH